VTGDVPATLVWIAPAPPDADQQRAMSVWARAQKLDLVAPRDERPPAIALDPDVVGEVEDLLDRARDATAARDAEAIDHATASAESLLRAHPELPQGAWLMAEVERARSTRARRIVPPDPAAAERNAERADALDGGRIPGLGELTATAAAPAAELQLGFPADDQAWFDGRPVPPEGAPPTPANGALPTLPPATVHATVATLAGLHAVVVTSGGSPIWAEWIELASGPTTLDADVPGPPACSGADVARARVAAATLYAEGVRCPRWIAMAPGTSPGGLAVASCEASQCGPLLEWHEAPAWSRPPPASARASHANHWPAWATWVLAGAGVAVATGVVIAASGALQAAPTETRFVTGGLKNQ
jgi:hypothetical protein